MGMENLGTTSQMNNTNNFFSNDNNFSSYNVSDIHNHLNNYQASSGSTTTSSSECHTPATANRVGMSNIDPRQNDLIAAELRRMQQVREEENNALMQLLSRQQQGGVASAGGGNGMGTGMAGATDPSNSSPFGSSQMNGYMNSLAGGHHMSMSSNHRDAMSSGMDSLGGSSQLNNFMSSSLMSGTMNMPGMDAANPMSATSASAQLKSSSDPSDLNMNNFFNAQNHLNMDSLGGLNEFLQKTTQQRSSAVDATTFSSNGNHGMNNTFNMASSMAHHHQGVEEHSNAMAQQQQQQQGGTRANSQEDPGWEEQYKALRAYHLQFGHCKVPARFKTNPKLGRWVMTQRRQFTLLMQGFPSALTADRIRRLESLGFVWSVRPEPVTTWNKKFHELKAYKATFGNCMVPQRYQANPQLGTWVHTQRRQYKLMSEGKKSSMTKEKAEALDSIGFFWAAKHCTSTTPTVSVDKLPSSYQADGNGILSNSSDRSGGSSSKSSARAA